MYSNNEQRADTWNKSLPSTILDASSTSTRTATIVVQLTTCSDILTGKWEVALEELNTVFQGRTLLIETFLSPPYLNTIQTACPWILRYLASAVILSRKTSAGASGTSSRVRYSMRGIVKVIRTEEYQYQDPVTSFLKELYGEFDFEAAQKELTLTVQIVGEDFFLERVERRVSGQCSVLD